MDDIEKVINDFVQFCNGEITEEEYMQGERRYQLTEKNITEMQNEADRELFGTY